MCCYTQDSHLCCIHWSPIHSDILFLELSTQVSVKYVSTILRYTDHYFFLYLHYVLHKYIVKEYFHIISSWQVWCHQFQPHSDQGVLKCRVISECQWLSVCQNGLIFMTYTNDSLDCKLQWGLQWLGGHSLLWTHMAQSLSWSPITAVSLCCSFDLVLPLLSLLLWFSKYLLELDYIICHMVSRLTNLVMSWSQGWPGMQGMTLYVSGTISVFGLAVT